MTAMVFKLVGGIGLFLLGMVLLTDGLKAFAGEALRRALVRFTGTPLKAFGSGALVTAMVQSSSATTVTVIGFVSAGLLTFPQAVGVVMGASLGTTGTGWIVAVLGLKISLGFYALPLVGVGAFMKLLGHGRMKSLGLALAGFGLIFIGIETLQTGMQGLSTVFDLARLPAGGFWGHVLALVIGVVLTVIMQSSSAAVATTLTALHTGAINFEQAASLVIGAAVGTTVTGALAAIGGSVPAKRTALAHVLFNLATGLIAVVLLPVFLWGIGWAQQHLGLDPGATSLAAFHTAFIALGVAVFLPFVQPFAARIERLLPDKGPILTAHLDDTLLHMPAVALETVRRSLRQTAATLFGVARDRLQPDAVSADDELNRGRVQEALDRTAAFFARIPPVSDEEGVSELRVELLHALDHLTRLLECARAPANMHRMLGHELLQPVTALCRKALETGVAGCNGQGDPEWLNTVTRVAAELAGRRRQGRPALLAQTASGAWPPHAALEALDATRWLDTMAYHTSRACHYLAGTDEPQHGEIPREPMRSA